jgi:hypothetical protein
LTLAYEHAIVIHNRSKTEVHIMSVVDRYPHPQEPTAMNAAVFGEHALKGQVAGLGVPPGFTRAERLLVPLTIDGAQFADILPLDADQYKVKALEYTTDMGNRVRIGDLRTETAAALGKEIPPGIQRRIDTAFVRDMKILGDNAGQARNTVTGLSGVGYTRVSSTNKMRAYWQTIRAGDQQGVRTIVRLGDCSTPREQVNLYRRLFGMRIRV